MNSIAIIIDKIKSAKNLDFGTVFNEIIELFKKTWVQGLILQAFTLIVMLPVILIFYIPFIGLLIKQQESGYNDPEAFNAFFDSMSVLYIVVLVIAVFAIGIIASGLNAAFFRVMKKLDYNEEVKTSDFFYFLKGKYITKLLLLMLAIILISIPSILLCYVPFFYAIVPMSFTLVFFAFNEEMSIGDIIKLSFTLGNKKWGITFGLLIVTYIAILVLTMMTCGIGQIFLQALLFHPSYLIYKHVVGFNEKSEIDTIGETEI